MGLFNGRSGSSRAWTQGEKVAIRHNGKIIDCEILNDLDTGGREFEVKEIGSKPYSLDGRHICYASDLMRPRR